MHNRKLYLIDLKKEILELLTNKTVLILWGMAFIVLLLFPLSSKKFFNNSSNITPNAMIHYTQIISIFLLGQYIFDGCKKDFSNGGGIFLLNIGSNCNTYLFGKRIVSFFLLIFLFLSRFFDLFEVFTFKSILLLFLFYLFVINNALTFSLLFFNSNTSFIAFILINFIPLLFFFVIGAIKFYIIKYICLILVNIVFQKNIPKIFLSKWFRKNIK